MRDVYFMGSTSNGKFTTRSAYLAILNEKFDLELPSFYDEIWKLPIPMRCLFFLFMSGLERPYSH